MIAALTLVVAFCSMVYELLLAQTLASTMGHTILRYNLTIGLYLASLGLGAFLFGRRRTDDRMGLLVNVELTLSLLGAVAPILVLGVDAVAHATSDGLGLPIRSLPVQAWIWGANHLLIVAIGLLSGFELPLLMALGAEQSPRTANRVLVLDYVGTLVAAVAFPFLLLPGLGVFGVAFLTGLLNVVVALALLLGARRERAPWRTAAALVAAAVFTVALVASDRVGRLAVDALYFRGL